MRAKYLSIGLQPQFANQPEQTVRLRVLLYTDASSAYPNEPGAHSHLILSPHQSVGWYSFEMRVRSRATLELGKQVLSCLQ